MLELESDSQDSEAVVRARIGIASFLIVYNDSLLLASFLPWRFYHRPRTEHILDKAGATVVAGGPLLQGTVVKYP